MKAVIFDCFGVLYLSSGQHFFETNVENYDVLRPELGQLYRQADYGYITQTDLEAAVAELTGLPIDFVSLHLQGTHRRNEPLLDFIQSIRQSCRVGMLSNIGPQSMDSYFSKEERENLFDTVVLSGEEGIAKPHPAIYQITAHRLGVMPAECIMIDDGKDNCDGADAAGMKPILYESNEQTIESIKNLLSAS